MRNLCRMILLMLLPVYAYAQTDSLERVRQDSLAITEADDFVTASILVISPSDVLYSCAGHACFRMQCPHYNLDVVYTYESENVTNRVWSFLQGNLKMGMTIVPTERMLADYTKEGRGVSEYILTLPLENRKQLWQYLDGKVEEGMNLPYDYLNRGCAVTCLRAVCAAVQPDTITFGPWDEKLIRKTRRTLASNQVDVFPWNHFFLQTIVGSEADRPCSITDKVVVYPDLINVLQKATFNGHPILGEPHTVVKQTVSIKESSAITPMMVACLMLVVSIIGCFWICRPVSVLLLVIQTAFGLVITYLIFLSSLPVTDFSWLIIPFNPLPLILWRWRKWWLLPFGIVCLIWSAVMLMQTENPIVDPAHIVLVFALALNYIGQYFQLRKA